MSDPILTLRAQAVRRHARRQIVAFVVAVAYVAMWAVASGYVTSVLTGSAR